jgi:hypothetical protein
MPRGKHLPPELRAIIFHFHVFNDKSAEEIYHELFLSDSMKISLRWLKDLCALFYSENLEQAREYLSGKRTRPEFAGRPQNLSDGEIGYITFMIKYLSLVNLSSLAWN